MNFVINNKQDKQTLFNYLKELDTDYIVKVKKQRTIEAICRTITIGLV